MACRPCHSRVNVMFTLELLAQWMYGSVIQLSQYFVGVLLQGGILQKNDFVERKQWITNNIKVSSIKNTKNKQET